MAVIGREDEQEILGDILQSEEPNLIALYGRRRVGKTFLIRNFFEKEIVFEISGMHNAGLSQQLENFLQCLPISTANLPMTIPQNWLQAFKMLTDHLQRLSGKDKKVIFFDEFPWLDSPRSGFMPAFENFWNKWASRQKNIIVIICGSAAAWMIKKVVNNKEGLHNRVTRRIRLLPFTLLETELYFQSRKINLDRYEIVQIYMAMGGVPQYLKEVKRGESAAQAIDRICFTKDGLLNDEFKNLYASLFDSAGYHVNIVKALAGKPSGLTRNEIIKICKLTSGGTVTKLLEELTESGFIKAYLPFGKALKDTIYKCVDEYSLFYNKFISGSRITGKGTWAKFSTGSSWRSWSGYAFGSICLKHILQIKRALGIRGVYTEESSWRFNPGPGNGQGAQIDLIIDRQDQCINLCEIKFSTIPFEVTKPYASELNNKMQSFSATTKTRKTLFLTLITTHGVKNVSNYAGLIQNEIKMEALFR